MNTKANYYIDQIYKKLKKINNKKINLEKDELKNFISFLLNNN